MHTKHWTLHYVDITNCNIKYIIWLRYMLRGCTMAVLGTYACVIGYSIQSFWIDITTFSAKARDGHEQFDGNAIAVSGF